MGIFWEDRILTVNSIWEKIPFGSLQTMSDISLVHVSDMLGQISGASRIWRERGKIFIRYRSSDQNVTLGRSSNRISSAEKAIFQMKTKISCFVSITGSGTNNGRLWSHLRAIFIDLRENWKISLKIEARAVYLCCLFALDFGPLNIWIVWWKGYEKKVEEISFKTRNQYSIINP